MNMGESKEFNSIEAYVKTDEADCWIVRGCYINICLFVSSFMIFSKFVSVIQSIELML
jgi:hypothetical protein